MPVHMADIEGNDTAFFVHEEQLRSGLGEKCAT